MGVSPVSAAVLDFHMYCHFHFLMLQMRLEEINSPILQTRNSHRKIREHTQICTVNGRC